VAVGHAGDPEICLIYTIGYRLKTIMDGRPLPPLALLPLPVRL
jgi:hypothetical protein